MQSDGKDGAPVYFFVANSPGFLPMYPAAQEARTLHREIEQFAAELSLRTTSKDTRTAYRADILQFATFAGERGFLADGAVEARRVEEAARAEKIAPRTLRRAREALGISSRPRGPGQPWNWQLPEIDDASASGGQHGQVGQHGNAEAEQPEPDSANLSNLANEPRRDGADGVPPVAVVDRERLAGRGAEHDEAVLAALAVDERGALGEVDAVAVERAEFGDAAAGRVEELEHAAVSSAGHCARVAGGDHGDEHSLHCAD